MYIQQLDFIKYKRTVFNDFKQETYQKDIAKDVELEKRTCEIFYFDYQMWKYIKRDFFPWKNKQKSKYVKNLFSFSKRLIQFLNKATSNSFLHDKGTRNLYTWVVKEVRKKYYTHYFRFWNC